MNISKFTQKSLEAVQNTEKLAYEYGNQQIDQPHLLYSLLTLDDSLIMKLITKMGIQGDMFKNEAKQAIEKLTKNLLAFLKEPVPETLPQWLVEKHHLMSLDEALRNIHYPVNPDLLRKAQYRLKFEELFYVQLNILRYSKDRQRKYRGFVFERVGEIFNTFYSKNLPFPLTNAQKRVIKEIRKDMGSGRPKRREQTEKRVEIVKRNKK